MKASRDTVTTFLAAALLIASSATAGEPSSAPSNWEFAGWYGGDGYPNVEFDPNVKDRVYLTSEQAGLWRSDDLGENWRSMNRGLGFLRVALFAVAPSDSNVLYAGTSGGLYRSRDAGQTWGACDSADGQMTFKRPDSTRSIAVSASEPGRLIVGTAGGGIFYSGDSGDHWKTLGSVKKPFQDKAPITAMEWRGEELLVSSRKGMAAYSFKQGAWEFFEKSPTGITDFYLSKNSPGKVIAAGGEALSISKDGGRSWYRTTAIPKGRTFRISAVETERFFKIYVAWDSGWQGGILSSRDEGATWERADQALFPDESSNPTRVWQKFKGKNNALKINPFSPRVLFRTDMWGVWRSDDAGKTWVEKIKGASNTAGADIFITGEGTLYVATMDQGLLASSNGGQGYVPLFPSKGVKKGINGHVWRVLALRNKLIATSSPWGEKVNQVILSEDGGRTFTVARSGLPSARPQINTMWREGYPRAIAWNPKDPRKVYLGIDGDDGGGLFISEDGGLNWRRSTGQPGSLRVFRALCLDSSDPERVVWGACGKNGGIYLSEDGGGSWRLVFDPMRFVFDMAVAGDGTLYASGDKNGPCLYASTDRGRSWQLLQKFPGRGAATAICVLPGSKNRIAVSTTQWSFKTGGRVFLSGEGGKNWTDITDDLPDGNGASAMAFNPADSHLYLIRYAGSVYKRKV